jgi:hypothetical protein
MAVRAAACLAVMALAACAMPPKLEIANAGRERISVGVDYHSKTVEPGAAFAALYSGRDFSVAEGDCLYKFRGVKGQPLKLRWSGGGRLEAEAGRAIAPIGKRCATRLE